MACCFKSTTLTEEIAERTVSVVIEKSGENNGSDEPMRDLSPSTPINFHILVRVVGIPTSQLTYKTHDDHWNYSATNPDKFQMSPVGGKVQIKLVGSDPLLYLSVFENPLGSVAERPKFHILSQGQTDGIWHQSFDRVFDGEELYFSLSFTTTNRKNPATLYLTLPYSVGGRGIKPREKGEIVTSSTVTKTQEKIFYRERV